MSYQSLVMLDADRRSRMMAEAEGRRRARGNQADDRPARLRQLASRFGRPAGRATSRLQGPLPAGTEG